MRAAACLAIVPAIAFAQPVPAPEAVPPPPVVQTVLPNLFATNPGTTAELRFDYTDIDGVDSTVFNLLAHVQFLTPEGFGGYARVPFGYVESADGDVDFGGSGIGNLEIGGLYVAPVSPGTELMARAGISIDTMSEDDLLPVTISTILPRLVDLYASGLETTWARGQLQLRHSIDSLRIGGAIGFDVPVAGEGKDSDFTGALNVVASAGFAANQFGIAFSFVSVRPFTGDDDADEEFVNGINLGADYALDPRMRLFAQLGFSLEDNSDGTSLGIGTRATF